MRLAVDAMAVGRRRPVQERLFVGSDKLAMAPGPRFDEKLKKSSRKFWTRQDSTRLSKSCVRPRQWRSPRRWTAGSSMVPSMKLFVFCGGRQSRLHRDVRRMSFQMHFVESSECIEFGRGICSDERKTPNERLRVEASR